MLIVMTDFKNTNRNPKITGPVIDPDDIYEVHVNAYNILLCNMKSVKYSPVVGMGSWTYVCDPEGHDLHVIRELERHQEYLVYMFEYECENRNPKTLLHWRRYVWQAIRPYAGQDWKAETLKFREQIKTMYSKQITYETQEERVHGLLEF